MRILHVGKFYPPHMGGIETHLQSLCEGLRGLADVRVIVANDHRQTMRTDVSGIDVTRCGTFVDFAAAPVCPSMISEIGCADADIIHLHQPHPTGMLAYLASGHKARVIVTYHSDIVRQKLLGRAFKPFLNNVLHRSSAIIATSPNYLATSPYLQAHQSRCHVIPYGIPIEQFQRCDGSRVAALHEKYGRRLIICVGRLVYYKGFEYLIRAMQW
ncbi:MAG: glycosyltransferase, partial [Pyrinomonadaceae bacterium]